MRILITGSNGHVGCALSKYFTKKGIAVVGFSRGKQKTTRKHFTFVRGDVRDGALLGKTLAEHKITHIIHLAFLVKAQRDAKFEHDVDVNGSIQVFRAANRTKTVRQFVHFSSVSVYGAHKNNPLWITETRKPRPGKYMYARNKAIVEEALFNATKRADMHIVNLRVCTVIGPTDAEQGVMTEIASPIGALVDGEDLKIQLIHENDLASLTHLVMKDKKIHGTFNVAPDSFATLKELNPEKIFISVPKHVAKKIIPIFWEMRMINMTKSSLDYVAHSLIVSPQKIMKRYAYTFKHDTLSGYQLSLASRTKKGTLTIPGWRRIVAGQLPDAVRKFDFQQSMMKIIKAIENK